MPSGPESTAEFLQISGKRLHVRRYGTGTTKPPVLFLHEGLGSVDLWRDFPDHVLGRVGNPGWAYSRHGNGWSTRLARPREIGYMHREALDDLAVLVESLTDRAPILVGHSDGASIALIHAGSGHEVAGLVLIAPHVFVEPETTEAIRAIRDSYEVSGLREKLAKYHLDPDATFYGWADIWLKPAFGDWNIESYADAVGIPTLLIQGEDDEYGTMAQLDSISSRMRAHPQQIIVPGAGHSPHLSDTELVASAVADFIGGLR